jgi:hypothetical protein
MPQDSRVRIPYLVETHSGRMRSISTSYPIIHPHAHFRAFRQQRGLEQCHERGGGGIRNRHEGTIYQARSLTGAPTKHASLPPIRDGAPPNPQTHFTRLHRGLPVPFADNKKMVKTEGRKLSQLSEDFDRKPSFWPAAPPGFL